MKKSIFYVKERKGVRNLHGEIRAEGKANNQKSLFLSCTDNTAPMGAIRQFSFSWVYEIYCPRRNKNVILCHKTINNDDKNFSNWLLILSYY